MVTSIMVAERWKMPRENWAVPSGNPWVSAGCCETIPFRAAEEVSMNWTDLTATVLTLGLLHCDSPLANLSTEAPFRVMKTTGFHNMCLYCFLPLEQQFSLHRIKTDITSSKQTQHHQSPTSSVMLHCDVIHQYIIQRKELLSKSESRLCDSLTSLWSTGLFSLLL